MKKVDADYEWYGKDCAPEPIGEPVTEEELQELRLVQEDGWYRYDKVDRKPMTLDEYAEQEDYADIWQSGYDSGNAVGYNEGKDAGYEEAIDEVDRDHLLLDRDILERLGYMLDLTRSAIRKTVDMAEDTDETSKYRKDLYDLHHEIYSLTECLVMDQVGAFWRKLKEED